MSRPAAVPPASKAETHPCKVCSVPTTMRCSRCAEAWYCSKEHIAEVWRLHKPTCYPRGTVQAILFPVDEDKPRMVTVEYWIEPPDEEDVMPSKSHRLNLKPWLGRTESVDLNRHGIEGPPIGRTLRLIWGDCHLKDGSKSNRSILRATKGLQVHNWAGNIMAFRAVEPYQYIAQVKDAVMEEDLEPIIAYFSEYRRILPRSLYQYGISTSLNTVEHTRASICSRPHARTTVSLLLRLPICENTRLDLVPLTLYNSIVFLGPNDTHCQISGTVLANPPSPRLHSVVQQ